MSERKARNLQPPVVVSRTDSLTEDEATPEECIESAFNDLRESLVADLRAKLADVNSFRFEQVVLDLWLQWDMAALVVRLLKLHRKEAMHGVRHDFQCPSSTGSL
jgi:hypothetical protein